MRSKRALTAVLIAWSVAPPAFAYLSPEHKRIGDEGAKAAFASSPHKLPFVGKGGRALVDKAGRILGVGNVYLTFGDLVALYGDFRHSVDELRKSNPKQLGALRNFASSGKVLSHVVALAKEGPQALSMFALNRSHFSSSAVSAYRDHHRTALEHAAAAGRSGDVARLFDALHHDALAGHSLTDLFAPGHNLVDRSGFVKDLLQGRDLMRAAGLSNPLAALKGFAQAAGAALAIPGAKRHHDQHNANGVELRNTRGDVWLGYGDGKFAAQTPAAMRLAPEAVTLSLRSLFDAYRRAKAGAADAELLGDPALYAALRLVPVAFRNAKYKPLLGKTEAMCAGTAFCDLLQRAVVNAALRLESPGSEAVPKLLEPAKADSMLRPGDVLLKRVVGAPTLIKKIIAAGQKAVKALRSAANGSVRAGTATVIHALVYVGQGKTADASVLGVLVRPISAQEGEVFEVFRPVDAAFGKAAADVAALWSNGRMKYSASPFLFLRSSSFGPHAKRDALVYGKARTTAGGPKSIKALLCSEHVLAVYQAAAVGAQLAKKPKLKAAEVTVPKAIALHAHNTSPLVLHGSLSLAVERKEWQNAGFVLIDPNPSAHGK